MFMWHKITIFLRNILIAYFYVNRIWYNCILFVLLFDYFLFSFQRACKAAKCAGHTSTRRCIRGYQKVQNLPWCPTQHTDLPGAHLSPESPLMVAPQLRPCTLAPCPLILVRIYSASRPRRRKTPLQIQWLGHMERPVPETMLPWGQEPPVRAKTSKVTTHQEAVCLVDAVVPPQNPEKVVRPFLPSTIITISPHITITCPRTTTHPMYRRPRTPQHLPLRTITLGRRIPFTVPCWGRRRRVLRLCQAEAAESRGVKADQVPVRWWQESPWSDRLH